jgi:cysteine/histidine-rich domain-containing protein
MQAVASLPAPAQDGEAPATSEGESCKNNGCKEVFSAATAEGACTHHPGYPVFHEGMKYWSCCQRKTAEFQEFLDQAGCDTGSHKWVADKTGAEVKCRYDWHQTATNVTVAVYAKKYDPNRSYVELSPVRLVIHLVFPAEGNNTFTLDLELKGVVEVEGVVAAMLGTKLEVKLKKAESGSWAKLDIPRPVEKKEERSEAPNILEMAAAEPVVDSLDLEDLDITPQRFQLSKEAQTKTPY